MLEMIWGYKTTAAMDVWTIEHILSGLSVGCIVRRNNRHHLDKHNPKMDIAKSTKYRIDLFCMLFLAYIWETIEHYLETGLAGANVAYWFQGVEIWSNRIIFDPLMLILGYMISKKVPQTVWPARVR